MVSDLEKRKNYLEKEKYMKDNHGNLCQIVISPIVRKGFS
jgi:hypothetical protein